MYTQRLQTGPGSHEAELEIPSKQPAKKDSRGSAACGRPSERKKVPLILLIKLAKSMLKLLQMLFLQKLFSLTEINSSINMDQFMYTEGKISRRAGDFGHRVKSAYNARSGNKCWCLLTDAKLPNETVIAGHLFKHQWKEYTHLIGINDIDCTQNGLPLWKPIEWAFDTAR